MQGSGPAQFTLPARAWAGLGVFGMLMLGALALQLAAVNHQREIAKRQERRTVAVIEGVRPDARRADALLDDVRELAPAARRLAVDGSALVRSAQPFVDELAGSEAGRTVRVLAAVGEDVLEARPGRALALVSELSEAALEGGRLQLALDRGTRTFDELARRGVLAKLEHVERLPELVRIQRRTLRIQLRTLAIQRRSLRLLERSLAVQEETLRHARSIDRKTGGELPASAGR